MGKLKILSKLGRQSSELSSPLPSSLTSHSCAYNGQPNSSQVARILNAIRGAENEVGEVVQQMQNNPDDKGLRRQYIMCVHFLEIHKGLLAPVHRLPDEILVHILHFCAIDPDPCWTNPPWVVAHVSRKWRVVALSFPTIWGVVPPVKISMKDKGKKFILRLMELLRRSGEQPLSIHISSDEDNVVDHPIVQILITHCARWRTAVMKLSVGDLQALTPLIRRRLSSLYSLKLAVRVPHDEDCVLGSFSIAPKLREVEIDCSWVRLLLPWEQLTKYVEQSTNPTGVIQVFSVSCEISYLSYCTRATPFFRFRPMTLANITTFDLNFHNPRASGASMLESLTLPALTDLRVRSSHGSLVDDLIDVIRRSKCPLQKLSIHTLPMEGGLTKILLFTSSLTEFHCNDLIEDDMERLLAFPGFPSVAPRLRKLVIQSDSPIKELNDMIISRHAMADVTNDVGSVAPASFTLNFAGPIECFEAQCVLEGWNSLDKALGDVITGWRKNIEREFVTWVTRSQANTWDKALMSVRATHLLGVEFRTLETYDFLDVKYIYSSGIHHLMNEVGNTTVGALPRAEGYNFRERARALVEKWKPLLLADVHKRHWMRRGPTTLEYVPDSSTLRHSKTGMLSIIFGVNMGGLDAYRVLQNAMSRR